MLGSTSPNFVGRLSELAELRAVATRVRGGEAWSVRIDGPPGVGATALARHFVSELSDFEVISSAASREETSTPFALVDHILSRLPRTGGCDTPFRYPALRDLSPPMVGAEIVHVAAELDDERPTALVIDDLQWADVESLTALRFALRRLGSERVLTILVGRRGRGSWDGLEHLHDWPERVVGLDLDGLSDHDVADLAQRVRGTDLDPAALQRLREVTDGNPLYVRALVQGGAEAEQFLAGNSDVAPSLIEAVQAVVASFPPNDRSVLGALAVLDRPATARQLASVSGLADAWSVARTLVPTGSVHVDGSSDEPLVALTSTTWRDAVLARLDGTRRRELHHRAAQVSDPPQRWRHSVEAATGPDPELCRQLEVAAGAELDSRRYARAAELLLLARGVPDCAATDRKLMTAARLLVAGGRGQRALALRDQVAELGASSERSETLALFEMLHGAFASARDQLISACEQLALGRHAADADGNYGTIEPPARLALNLAFVRCMLGEGPGAIDAANDALEALPEGVWADATRAFLANGLALRDGAEAGLAELSWLPAEPSAAASSALPALAQRGSLRGLVGDLDLAVDDLTTSTRRRADVPSFVGIEPHVHLAWCHYQRGTWAAAERALDVASHAEALDRTFDRATIRAMSAVLRAGRGDIAGAVGDASACEQLLEGVDHVVATVQGALARAAIAQARGSASGVVHALDRLGTVTGNPDALSDRYRLYAAWWLPILADAQIATGRLADAGRTMELLATCPRQGAMLEVAAAWIDGQLLERRGDRSAALRRFRTGLDAPPRGGEPAWYRSHLRAAYGAALVEAGRTDEGVQLLRSAVRSFTEMGAVPFAERTQRTADLAVQRPAPVVTTWRDPLTAREREVAGLVGLGWTNVEIGRELFVSVKTVEHHLRNTFTKLGITSRRELRDLVQADDQSRSG